jgi:hypothetical protein
MRCAPFTNSTRFWSSDQLHSKATLATCLIVLGFAVVIQAALPADKRASTASLSEAWSFMAFAAPYGRFKAVTTRDTTLVDNGVFRYSLQGPRFDLFKVLNPENKSYIQTTVSQYSTQWAPSIKYPKLKKIGRGKLLKLECAHYIAESYKPGVDIDAWFTEEIPMEKGLSDSFSKLCGLPTGYGLPVKLQFISQRSKEKAFELLKIDKTTVVSETLLVPKNYHLMKDQALFFLTDEDGKNTGIDEFMRSKPLTQKRETPSQK